MITINCVFSSLSLALTGFVFIDAMKTSVN